MDHFQRDVIDRLARIETKTEALVGLDARVTTLEKAEGRRNAIVGALVALPAAIVGAWHLLRGAPS